MTSEQKPFVAALILHTNPTFFTAAAAIVAVIFLCFSLFHINVVFFFNSRFTDFGGAHTIIWYIRIRYTSIEWFIA